MKYRIFLASSAELITDRQAFEIFLARLNDEFVRLDKHVHFDLYVWERESEAVFETHKQDQYNQNLANCDLFVLLAWTKVGMWTNKEFDIALSRFRATGKPLLFTYKKIAPPSHIPSEADQQSLAAFDANLLHEVGHFTGSYALPAELTTGFRTELDKLFASGYLQYGVEAECLFDAGKAVVPDTFVGREDDLIQIRQRLQTGGRLVLINAEGGMGKTTVAARYWDQHLYQYQHMAWLFCDKGIVEEIKGLAPALGLDLSQYADEKQQIDAIRTALNNKTRTGDCLLVLDNANDPDQIRAFQQHFSGLYWHVLMTSRCSAVLENEFPIRHLPPPVAKKLFTDLYPPESGAEFDALLDQFLVAVGYNTLAIEIFAKNLTKANKYHRETLSHFLTRLTEKGLLLGDKSFKVKTGYLLAVHKSQPSQDATTDQIIEALYDLTQLSDTDRYWLVNMALLPAVSHEAYFLGQLFGMDAANLSEEYLEVV